jgi:pyrrolidone-carboxylate peptidase
VPSVLAPADAGEDAPWLLAPDAEAIVGFVNEHAVAAAGTAPFAVSEDAGGYYCDHLCVELARLSRRTGAEARFLHVTAIDGCDAAVREARLGQYARQVAAVARYLEGRVWAAA